MKSRLPYTPKEFVSWNEAKRWLTGLPSVWIFRGQKMVPEAMGLHTSLERMVPMERMLEAETITLWNFKARARRFLPGNGLPDSDLEWLALMQHHGCSTRLLDWTFSPYVASFFAMEDPAEDCVIWVIHAGWCVFAGLGEHNATSRTLPTVGDGIGGLSSKEYFSSILSAKAPGLFPVVPLHLHERLTAQQGLFLFPGDPTQGFEDNLLAVADSARAADPSARIEDALFVVRLPKAWRTEVMRDLLKMNISRATLFPGLDGIAQSLKNGLTLHNWEAQ